jgi:hypothetical protein
MELSEETCPVISYRDAMSTIGGSRPSVIEKPTVMAETPVRVLRPPASIVLAILALVIRNEQNLSPETDRTH